MNKNFNMITKNNNEYEDIEYEHEKLTNIPLSNIHFTLPDIQRLLIDDHVKTIYNSECKYYQKHKKYLILGNITIVLNKENNKEYLIDGQHRIYAYYLLQNDYPDRQILLTLDKFTCNNNNTLDYLYKLINNTKINPISQLEIDEYKIINDFQKIFNINFKDYLRSSKNPHKPYMNLEGIIETLTKNIKSIIALHHISTGEELYDIIMKLNKYYHNVAINDPDIFGQWKIKNYEKSLQIINSNTMKNKLYLGMYDNYIWIHILSSFIQEEWDYVQHKNVTSNDKITKALKNSVWDSKSLESNCFCCNSIIHYDNFICGHIISIINGGTNELSNLKPICYTCDKNMGNENMMLYKLRNH